MADFNHIVEQVAAIDLTVTKYYSALFTVGGLSPQGFTCGEADFITFFVQGVWYSCLLSPTDI
jgi:hypothetical protein